MAVRWADRVVQNYAQEYFDALEKLVGRREDRINRVPSGRDDGLPHAHSIFFNDLPRAGVLTAFTVGLGLGLHGRGLDAHVELVVSMQTTDLSWGAAVAFLGEQCRVHVELEPGATLDMKEPLASGSTMSGFIIARPSLWPSPPILSLSDRRVAILEARALYPAELAFARLTSRDRILDGLAGPNYDPRRRPVVVDEA